MCGRYTLIADGAELSEQLGAPWRNEPLGEPRFNLAPTQHAPVLRGEDAEPVLEMFRWGLIPAWATDPTIGNRLINARAETVHEKPAFRAAYARRRCLVPASGFFEWQKAGSRKVPHWIHPQRGGLVTFAGLWERWSPAGAEPVLSFAILTTSANHFMAPLHERMPVVVAPEDRARWLSSETSREELASLLEPAPEDLLHARPVSTWVNSPAHDDAGCIEPATGDD